MVEGAPSLSYECADLLAHVAQEQARVFPESNVAHFGHPPAPALSLFQVKSSDDLDSLALMVAYTSGCISAQVLTKRRDESTTSQGPVSVCSLPSSNQSSLDHGEDFEDPHRSTVSITCLSVFALEDSRLVASDDYLLVNEDVDDPSQGFQKESLHRIAVVFGTSESRIFSVELLLNTAMSSIKLSTTFPHENMIFEPLPLDNAGQRKNASPQKYWFHPTGGVSHLQSYSILQIRKTSAKEDETPRSPASSLVLDKRDESSTTAHVWISYGDGTIIRLHHSAFFRSVVCGDVDGQVVRSLADRLLVAGIASKKVKMLVRCQAQFTTNYKALMLMVLPLPKYHPSPLAPLLRYDPELSKKQGQEDDPLAQSIYEDDPVEEDENDCDNNLALEDCYEALLYCTQSQSTGTRNADGTFPTFSFYTSEDHFSGRVKHGDSANDRKSNDNIVLDAVIGGAGAVFSGVLGAVSWGFGGGGGNASTAEKKDPNIEVQNNGAEDSEYNRGYFPSLRATKPIELFPGFEINDSPRQVEACTIDPGGDLAAVTDTFGRVLLLDLATKQIVRMWKGFREAECYWLQVPLPNPQGRRHLLFLVIHTRQRKVVEIFRVRHGPRVKTIPVGRDAQIIVCKEWIKTSPHTGEYISTCYLAHSSGSGAAFTQVDKIDVETENKVETPAIAAPQDSYSKSNTSTVAPLSAKEAALRLQHLQQLLADTNVPCQLEDVHTALSRIKSLKDLASSLDRIALSPALEMKMKVNGSDFQNIALKYCQNELKAAVKGTKKDVSDNPHVQTLANKILYHSQVVNAYDILHKFELGRAEEGDQPATTKSQWIEEAMGWVGTYEKIYRNRVNAMQVPFLEQGVGGSIDVRLKFFEFAKCCMASNYVIAKATKDTRKLLVHLSDSSKTRRDALIHIFRPLLHDIFAYSVVNSIFEALGILDDANYLQMCFGEWYMTLPIKLAAQKCFYSLQSPMMRWLEEMVVKELEAKSTNKSHKTLNALYEFCEKSEDLLRACMLGTLCREAVLKAATRKEEKSYGKVSSTEKVGRWEKLLRKLRVCSLVSLRLKGIRMGTIPVTIHNLEEEEMFSVYEWVALDELEMSHNHQEIVSLENACKGSPYSFDPSTKAGDERRRFEMLQRSCLSAALSEDERFEYLVSMDDDIRLGALLLYLNRFNEGDLLVAHRALLLSSSWSQQPENISLLQDALEALQNMSLSPDYESLAFAVRLEVWQTQLRPIYRALLFGFEDVQELSEGIVAPLLQKPEWLHVVGVVSLKVLTLLFKHQWKNHMNLFAPFLPECDGSDESWPPVQVDFILNRLVQRSRHAKRNALDAHRAIVCALLVSDDLQTIVDCVPSFHDCFEQTALFDDVEAPRLHDSEQKEVFLEEAIVNRAQVYAGPAIETVHLGEIEVLATIWGFDMKEIRTKFFLAMYELGKDRWMDELLTKSAQYIEVADFVANGVDIVCRRLNDLLHVRRSQHPALRDIMGLLDADTCLWVRERSDEAQPLVIYSNLQVPIGSTHLLALRLLSLSRGAQNVEEIASKIHSLIVLSGMIVKAMESR